MTDVRSGDALDSLPVMMAVRRVLRDAASADEAAAGVLDRVGETLSWRMGAFWVPGPDGAGLRAFCTWRHRVHRPAGFEEATRRMVLRSGEGLPGRAWANEDPVCVSDVATDGNFPRHDVAAGEGLRVAVAVPVDGLERRHGVLEFFSDQARIRIEPLLPAFARVGRELGAFLDQHPLSAGGEE